MKKIKIHWRKNPPKHTEKAEAPRIQLSKRSIAMATSVIALSNMASALAVDTQAASIPEYQGDTNISIINIDRQQYQRKALTENVGTSSVTSVLVAILEDARGTCLGGVRCLIAFNDSETSLEERFQSLRLEEEKVGEYALSISGNASKARILAILENKEDDHFYTHYLLNNFIELKETEMQNKGLTEEAKIAKSAIIKDIGKYTAIAMNPHAEESMVVIEQGLNILNNR